MPPCRRSQQVALLDEGCGRPSGNAAQC